MGRHVELALWDTAGQESFDCLRPISYPDTNVILLCYSVDNADSFENLQEKWLAEVKHFCGDVPILLIGNKSDLRTNKLAQKEVALNGGQMVDQSAAEEYASRIGAAAHYECSAKTRENVQAVFEAATRAALLWEKPKKRRMKCALL